MAVTFKQRGNTRTFTNGTGVAIAAGAIVVLRSGASGECGVAVDAVAVSGVGTVTVSGVHTLAKASGLVSAHALVYRGTAGTVTTTSTSGTLLGVATAAAATAATTCLVLVNERPGTGE